MGSSSRTTHCLSTVRLESLTPPALHPSFCPQLLCQRFRIQVEFRRSPQRRPRFSRRRKPCVFLFRPRPNRRRRPLSFLRCLPGDLLLRRLLLLSLRHRLPPLRRRLWPPLLQRRSLRHRHLRRLPLRALLRPRWPSRPRTRVPHPPPLLRPRLPSLRLNGLPPRQLPRARPVWIWHWLLWRWCLPLRRL